MHFVKEVKGLIKLHRVALQQGQKEFGGVFIHREGNSVGVGILSWAEGVECVFNCSF